MLNTDVVQAAPAVNDSNDRRSATDRQQKYWTVDEVEHNGLIQPRAAIWAIEDFFIDCGTGDKPSAPCPCFDCDHPNHGKALKEMFDMANVEYPDPTKMRPWDGTLPLNCCR